MDRFVTTKEVAAVLDCSAKTVSRRVKQGVIPAIQPGGPGTHLRFDVDEVMRAVKESHTFDSASDTSNPQQTKDPNTKPKKLSGPRPKWKQKSQKTRKEIS